MSAFSYTRAQSAAILAALRPGPAVRPNEAVDAITKAAQQALKDEETYRLAPIARQVIEEMEQLEVGARRLASTLSELKSGVGETAPGLRSLLIAMRKRGYDLKAQALSEDLSALAEAAADARAELSMDDYIGRLYRRAGAVPFMIDGVRTARQMKRGRSRAGAEPNVALSALGRDLAFIYRLATMRPPTISRNKTTGRAGGPFCEFLEAAVRPTGLLRPGRRVDALARAAQSEFRQWAEAIDSGTLQDIGIATHAAALVSVAERLGITWPPQPREVI